MVLRNYYNYIAAMATGGTSTDTTTFGDGHLNGMSTDGLKFAFKPSGSNNNAHKLGVFNELTTSSTPQSIGLMFGTGTTAVTFDDYQLSSQITSGLTYGTSSSGSVSFNSSDNSFNCNRNILITNTSASDKTIREIGIAARVEKNTASTSSCAILIYREVLNNPFTLTAGQTVTYTHSFKFTMPTIS